MSFENFAVDRNAVAEKTRDRANVFFGGGGGVNFGVVVISSVGRECAVTHQVCCCFTCVRNLREKNLAKAERLDTILLVKLDSQLRLTGDVKYTPPTDVPSLRCGAASGMLGAVLFAGVCFKIRPATIQAFAHA